LHSPARLHTRIYACALFCGSESLAILRPRRAVGGAAEEASEAAAGSGPEVKRTQPAAEPFSRDELKKYFERNAARLRSAAEKRAATHAALAGRLDETAKRLDEARTLLESPSALDLEDLERRLTVLEEKLTAALSADADEEAMLAIRREMDRSLAPYRRKMSADQLAQLERQYIQKRLYELFEVPRLSLFYLT